MEKLTKFRASIMQEIHQNELLQKNLLVQILASRRLLGDHCELLEEAVADLPALDQKHSNVVSLLNTTGVVATCSIAFSMMKNHYRYLIPCISGAIPIMYAHKLFNSRKREQYESGLKEFVKSLDEFEFTFKKIQTFFNDAMIMEQHAKILERYNKDDQVAINLVYTIKRVIRALYCFLKYLEYFYKIDDKLKCIYPEVDDVDNCAIMCEENYDYNDSKTYKDFFSLYAFVQSHLLLRLGFIFATNLNEAKFLLQKKLPDITSKIKTQTKLLPNFLDIQKYSPKLKENVQKQIKDELNKMLPKDLIQIRTSTIEFTLKALGLALQSQELEVNITRLAESYENPIKKDVDDVMNNMQTIKTQIDVCKDEETRLMILINKYLKNETEEKSENAIEQTPAEPNVLEMINEEDMPEQKDDFFYHDPSTEVEQEKEEDNSMQYHSAAAELDEWQLAKTKKSFTPVLEQLKERIVPIEEDMKEREKKSLKEKGIEVPEEENNDEVPEEEKNDEASNEEEKNDEASNEEEKNDEVPAGEENGDKEDSKGSTKSKSWLQDMEEQEEENNENWDFVTDRKKKRQNKKNRKYEQNRDFLKSKEQINLLNHVQSKPIQIPHMAFQINNHEEIIGDD